MGFMDHSRYPPGGGDPPEGGEILERRGWPMPVLFARRPPRAVLLAAAALLVGLAAGYAAGSLHTGKTPAPPARHSAAVSAAPSLVLGGFPLSQTGPACSAQLGRELQVGVEVTNTSAATITISRVEVVLPLRGLTVVSQAWGTCGELPAVPENPGNVLPAGGSTWFTVTFRVLVKCPGPLPVQFRLDYLNAGRTAVAALPGFDDLGQVPYAGCHWQV
jgi:hypothetical protein